MAEIRQDPITGRRVIIAPRRADRPHLAAPPAQAETSDPCPFCRGNEAMTPPEVWADREAGNRPDAPDWRVRIVSNKYPALEPFPDTPARNNPFYPSDPAAGMHEVIIESPDHDIHFSALGAEQYAAVLRAYRARWRTLEADARWRYLLIYKNQGERAGATLDHVHSQLVALEDLPRSVAEERDRARSHFELTGRCLSCEIIELDRQAGARLVLQSGRFIALCPHASRFAYETWVVPRVHAPRFTGVSDAEIAELAALLRRVIIKLAGLAARVPFNLLIHSAPSGEAVDQFCHWRMEILPQLHRAAGFEWGSGMHMNPVAPEEAARLLRDAPR